MERKIVETMKGHSDPCVLDLVSEILLQIIRELYVYKPNNGDKNVYDTVEAAHITKNEDFYDEELTPHNKDMQHQKNCCMAEHSKTEEKNIVIETNNVSTNFLDDFPIQSKAQDLLHCKVIDNIDQEDNSCGKERLLSALNLSPALIYASKEKDVDNMDFAGKKKESVHFNSPVAVVYEFSEISEAASDNSTEILSDSESEVLILSQDEHTKIYELELGSGDACSKTIYDAKAGHSSLNVKEDSPDGSRDSIMTPGGDFSNVKLSSLSTNFDADLRQINSTSDCNKITLSPQNLDRLLIDHNELCHKEKKENIDTITENLNCKDIEDRQDTNDAIEDSKTIFYSQKIVLDIDPCERYDNQQKENYQANLKEKAQILTNFNKSKSGVAGLLTLENESKTKDFCFSDVFTKFPLNKEENNVEHLQDMFIDLSQSDAVKDNMVVKSENDPSSNTNRNEGGQASDVPSLNKPNKQDLITQKNCKILHEDIEQDIDKECELKDERIEPSQQCIKLNTINKGNAVYSKIEVSDMTENVLLSGQKREQSSPELHCTHVSKKSKSETSFNLDTHTKKRKLFKVELDENKNVKLMKLDFDNCQSGMKNVPKMLKQLASNVIAEFDENVIFESTYPEKKQEDCSETQCNQVTEKIIPDNQILSITGGINNSFKANVKGLKGDNEASIEGQDAISDGELSLNGYDNELQQKEPSAVNFCESVFNENKILDSKMDCSDIRRDIDSYQFDTSKTSSMKDNNFPDCQMIPKETEINSSPNSLSQDSGIKNGITSHIETDQTVPEVSKTNDISCTEKASKILLQAGQEFHDKDELAHVKEDNLESQKSGITSLTSSQIESDQSIPVTAESNNMNRTVKASNIHLHTGEEFHNKDELVKEKDNSHSPKFITATELFSQSSQKSGSTGFTDIAEDESKKHISFDKSENIQNCTAKDLEIENNFCGINLKEQKKELSTFDLCESEFYENGTLDSKVNSDKWSDTDHHQFETSKICFLRGENLPECQMISEDTEIMSSSNLLSKVSDIKNITTSDIETDQSVPEIVESNDREKVSNILLQRGQELHNMEELAHVTENIESQKFITTTELLSQSSQENGSTGFTVTAEDLPFRDDSQTLISIDKFEVIHNYTIKNIEIKNGPSDPSPTEQVSDQEILTNLIHSPKNMLEITEDGLKEEKLEDVDYDVVAVNEEKRSSHSIYSDCIDKSCATTDQDEQIATDQLDIYIDRAVDRIVPDDQYDCENVDKVKEHTMFVENEDKKAKEHASDQGVCDEQGSIYCQKKQTQGQFYEKCFNWKYRPSYDPEGETSLPELPDEDQVVTITPLKTCGKPLRLGLSKRQPVRRSLHQFVARK